MEKLLAKCIVRCVVNECLDRQTNEEPSRHGPFRRHVGALAGWCQLPPEGWTRHSQVAELDGGPLWTLRSWCWWNRFGQGPSWELVGIIMDFIFRGMKLQLEEYIIRIWRIHFLTVIHVTSMSSWICTCKWQILNDINPQWIVINYCILYNF